MNISLKNNHIINKLLKSKLLDLDPVIGTLY